MQESSLLPHLKSLLPITVLQRFQRRGAPAKPNRTQQGNSANNMRSNGQLRVKHVKACKALKPRSNQLESSNLSSNGAQRPYDEDNQPQTATPWSSSPDPRYKITPQEQGTVSSQTTNLECSGGTPKRLQKRQIHHQIPADHYVTRTATSMCRSLRTAHVIGGSWQRQKHSM